MPFALELREAVEHVRKAEMNVRRGGIDAELHAQRPAELQLPLELSFGQDVDRVLEKVRVQADDSRRPGRCLARRRGVTGDTG